MPGSSWENRIKPLQGLVGVPIQFNDLFIVLIDACIARHEANWYCGVHSHSWFELHYISKGKLLTRFNDCEFLAEAGSFYLVPPNVNHSHRKQEKIADEGICLRWHLDAVQPFRTISENRLSAKKFINKLSTGNPYSIKYNIEDFIDSISGLTSQALEASFIQWIFTLYSLVTDVDNDELIPKKNDRDHILVQQVLLYLSSYYKERINVRDIANSLNISYRHLARIFKKVTGFTVVEKLIDIRINQAKKLLLETDKTVHEIAEEVGLNNEYYFSNIFKEHVSVSPSSFRSNYIKNIS